MPREKYRVHEVAKDFGVNSKKVLEVLSKYTDEPRKHMTALEDRELDIIFETITQENQVESFDNYFRAGENELQAKAEKESAKEKAGEPAKEESKKVKTDKKSEKKAEKKDKSEKKDKK